MNIKGKTIQEADNMVKDYTPEDIFQFLIKVEDEEKLKSILIKENWFMGTLYQDADKQCNVYRKSGKIFFKTYDNNVYQLDLRDFSGFLVRNKEND